MSKVLKVVGTIAGFVAMGAAIASGFGAVAIAGMSLATIGAAAGVVALGASLLAGKPKAPQTSTADRTRLVASINTREPRKAVYGNTAFATDIRDEEYTGSDQEYFHRFIVLAAHKIGSVTAIWFDDVIAWTLAGGVQGDFVGFLDVAVILEGTAGNAINISPRMGSTRRYTGMAYVHFRYKITGPDDQTQSPFAQSVPTRLTIIGDGMPVYDPRKDSTAGGSGSQRIDDQDTWGYDDDAHLNPPLQLLNYLIGYRINGLISVGKGIPPARIDIASFLAAANLCDEEIALAGGGTEPRYRTSGIFSEADQMDLVLNQFKSSMNATLDDVDGQIRLYVLHNDLTLPVADFTDDDILADVDWHPNIRLTEHFNIIRGSHTDPSDEALYQSITWGEIEIESVDGIDRIENIDFPLVESTPQCQRLAKQRLQRMQYSGVFSATYQRTAWAVQKGDVIRQSFTSLGFVNKLFRVLETGAQTDGTVPMVLREENAAIYAWDADEQAAVTAAPPDVYDYTKNPLYAELAKKTTAISEAQADASAAISLAMARGKVWFQDTAPSAAESNLNDTWIPSSGVFYKRVGGSIVLGGKVIVLGGFRPSLIWTELADQPLAAAIASADAAAIAAALANAQIEAIAADGILSRDEKLQLVREVNAILKNHAALDNKAASLGSVETERSAAQDSIDDLTSYLAGLSPAWDDPASDTAIDRDTFNLRFDNAAEDVAGLQAAIQGKKGNYIDLIFFPPSSLPATPTGTSPVGWSNQPEESGYYSKAERRADDGALVSAWSVPVKLGSFRNRGAYDAAETYFPDDTVQYSGGTYGAVIEHSGVAPSGSDQDNAAWFVVAAPGSAGAPAVPPGAFSDTINLTTTTGVVNLRTLADAAGYTGASDATITFNVPTGVTITGNSGGVGISSGSWPSGYTINLDLSVTGKVYGGGGYGGRGESGDNGGTDGASGGDAIHCLNDIDIIVNSGGEIKGGGGGGGGGRGTTVFLGGEPTFFGGGGGGGGAPNGPGGAKGFSDGGTQASDGSAGSAGGGGAGGAFGSASYSSAGANGGNFAAAGGSVASARIGGAAGYAIRKNGKTVNVTNGGTITGTQG